MAVLKRQEDNFGTIAEALATDMLRRQGYLVREKNWRPPRSHKEIDIIAQQGQTLIFVEVKARNPKGIDPVDAITPQKIRNMVACARSYLNMQEIDYHYRFDIISVVGTCVADAEIEHFPDAFLPPLTTR